MAGKKRATKDKEIRFRGTKLDEARLEALARITELTPSAVMRRLLAEECERRKVVTS